MRNIIAIKCKLSALAFENFRSLGPLLEEKPPFAFLLLKHSTVKYCAPQKATSHTIIYLIVMNSQFFPRPERTRKKSQVVKSDG